MSKAYTKWDCGICSNKIAWDELFTFLSDKRVVHFECLKKESLKSSKTDPETLNAVLDALQEELVSLVNYKGRMQKTKDEEVKKTMEAAYKDAEKNAAIMTRMVEKLSKNQ